MKVFLFCFFLVVLGLTNVNCLIRHDAATWTGRVVIQYPSGEWAAQPKEFSPRRDGGVCDDVVGFWALANVRNDGEHSAGGPVICTPDSEVIPVGEHALPEYLLRTTCPEGYHDGSIFDATVYFDSNAVAVGKTFLAYWYNPRESYAKQDVVVSPNFESAKHGFELELFDVTYFVDNPGTGATVTDKLCVRNDVKFTFSFADQTNITTRTDKNDVCQNLNDNYRAATAAELSQNIKSFFSFEDIKPYVRAFLTVDTGITGTNPIVVPTNFVGIANGIVVADDPCRSYIPTYGIWETTPECNEVDVAECECNDRDVPLGDATCTNDPDTDLCVGAEEHARHTVVYPDFIETNFPLLSVHDNRYSRALWRETVRCPDEYNIDQRFCARTGSADVTWTYGCKAIEIGAHSQVDRNVVPVACIFDPYARTDIGDQYDFDDSTCPTAQNNVPPTWSHGRSWLGD